MYTDPRPLLFEWDAGNAGKNKKHNVEDWECEEVFYDPHKVTLRDPLHSADELRYIVIGVTRHGRLLFVVYTRRVPEKVRVISARDISKQKEKVLYEKAT